MKIVVIIPTYNESENVERAVSELQKVFNTIDRHEFHILVVDDSSPDGTADIVRHLIKENSNLHLLLRKKKEGLGAAYLDALDYSFDTMNADVSFNFDCDLSHDPKVLPEFVFKLENGADQVIGTRYRKGGGIPDDWGIHRKILSVFGNKFISLLYLGSNVTDFTGGYKAITQKVYKDIREGLTEHSGYTYAISTNLETLRKGYKIEEVPFHFVDRTDGNSKMGKEYFKNALFFVIKSRIQDFLNSRFGKVFIAGGLGATAQLLSYAIIFRRLIEVQNVFGLQEEIMIVIITVFPTLFVSQLLSIEVGLVTAFTVNNYWAFKDKRLQGFKFVVGFIKNHIVVLGAIIIQLIIAQTLAMIFGTGFLRNFVFQAFGILVGLFWNFYFYKKIIWRVSK